MNFSKSWTFQTLNWNAKTNQLEAEIKHITPVSKFKVLNHNTLNDGELSTISFKIIDNKGNSFNEDTLNNLLKINIKESEEYHSEIKQGVPAKPPFTFVLKSNGLNLENLDFQISYLIIKQEVL